MSASPVHSLHHQALENIFAFASLRDLASLMSVSQSWQAAVLGMRPLGSTFVDSMHSFASSTIPFESRLVRHLYSLQLNQGDDQLESFASLSPLRLEHLSRHATHLQSLSCIVASSLRPTISFPPKLTALQLTLHSKCTEVDFERSISALSALPVLSSLQLTLAEPLHGTRFSSLAHIASLRSLELVLTKAAKPLSAAQEDDLRTLSQLTSFDFPALDEAAFWRLLRPGHALRLTNLEARFGLIESATTALAALPSLTHFRGRLLTWSWSFLVVLPNLSHLILSAGPKQPVPAIESMRECASLLHLTLHCGRNARFTADYLSALFNHMPQLRSLAVLAMNRRHDMPKFPPLLTKLEFESAAACGVVCAAIWPLVHLQELTITAPNWTAELRRAFKLACARLPALVKFTDSQQ